MIKLMSRDADRRIVSLEVVSIEKMQITPACVSNWSPMMCAV